MPLQFKRGTTEQCEAFIPLEGQPLWNVDTSILTVGDGVTPGGVSLLSSGLSVNSIPDMTPFVKGFALTVTNQTSAASYLAVAPAVHTHYIADIVDMSDFGAEFVQSVDAATAIAVLSAVSYVDFNALQATVTNNQSIIAGINTRVYGLSSEFISFAYPQTLTSPAKDLACQNAGAVRINSAIPTNKLLAVDAFGGLVDSGVTVTAVSAFDTRLIALSAAKADKSTTLNNLPSHYEDGVLAGGYDLQVGLIAGAPYWQSADFPLAQIKKNGVSSEWILTDTSGTAFDSTGTPSGPGFPQLPHQLSWTNSSVITRGTGTNLKEITDSINTFIDNAIVPFILPTDAVPIISPYQISFSIILNPTHHGRILYVDAAVSLFTDAGLPDGFTCEVVQTTAAQATFSPGTMPIVNSFGLTKTRGIYSVASIRVINGVAYTSGDMV